VSSAANFQKAFDQFSAIVAMEKQERSRSRENRLSALEEKKLRRALYVTFTSLIATGRKLATWGVDTRDIPRGEEKFFEIAARTFLTIRKMPTDPLVWFERHRGWAEYLLKVAGWPERVIGTSQVEAVGPLRVHNTIGADAQRFSEILALVGEANRVLSETLDFSKTLYGDVYFVGQLQKASAVAWYSLKEDKVYVRPLERKGLDDLESLLHELGHRYWYRVMDKTRREAISQIWFDLRSGSKVVVPPIRVGDPFPIPVQGHRVRPHVVGVDAMNYRLSTGGLVSRRSADEVVKRNLVRGRFPSLYSMKDITEFFAECFAFFVLNRKLSPELSGRFRSALKA